VSNSVLDKKDHLARHLHFGQVGSSSDNFITRQSGTWIIIFQR